MIRSSDSAKKKWNEVVFDAPLTDGGHLHAVLLYSDGGLNAGLIRKGEIVTLDLVDVGFRGPATVVAIQRSSIQGDVEAEVIRVVQFRDDNDLGKALYGEWKPPQDFLERWAGRRRTLVMRMDFPDGRWCDIQLLRTVKWMEQNRVRVGGAVFLDLSHVGVRGWANVLEILPCPIPEDFGDGEMVTGTFKYSHGRIGELVLQSEPKPIGVTPSHLFWSEDRQDWVQVSQLRPGETVQTMNGVTRVVSFTMTDRIEPVYNIEVAHDHCYRVGETGVLVHNQSAPAYQAWFQSLERCNLPAPGPNAAAFERRACGTTQYWIVGGGTRVCIDAIEGTAAVDCKAIENPGRSAQLGQANEFWAELGPALDLRQLQKIADVVNDSCNPLTKLIIAVEDQRAAPYWEGLLGQVSVDWEVQLR